MFNEPEKRFSLSSTPTEPDEVQQTRSPTERKSLPIAPMKRPGGAVRSDHKLVTPKRGSEMWNKFD
ncbi:hypothetical protein Q7C36_000519 [Tachysurus vachellii]|uniref:Uncharacterized protein n=1 Tax=Tachysurus vachellii TaxID=175792 RepID=A0AA88P1V8_TACVA|nr:hypothetical protein Q7C36_000519 [Tachysurus vachellii]